MSLLIETYPHLDTRKPPTEATFAWFLASAPDTALGPLGVFHTPKLGATCLNIAITASVNAGHHGRIGLHAAVPNLAHFYLGSGLIRLPAAVPLPVARATMDFSSILMSRARRRWWPTMQGCARSSRAIL